MIASYLSLSLSLSHTHVSFTSQLFTSPYPLQPQPLFSSSSSPLLSPAPNHINTMARMKIVFATPGAVIQSAENHHNKKSQRVPRIILSSAEYTLLTTADHTLIQATWKNMPPAERNTGAFAKAVDSIISAKQYAKRSLRQRATRVNYKRMNTTGTTTN